MACHELSALRLGLMKLGGIDDEAEKQHELAELGGSLEKPGPLSEMTKTSNFKDLLRNYQQSLVGLQEKVSKLPEGDKSAPYYRSLLITTKKVELELIDRVSGLERMFRDLEEVHDYIHEVYPD